MATPLPDRPLAAPAPGAVPPGWYPDPLQPGGWRWWDGLGWTAHAALPPSAGGVTATAGKPRLKRWMSVPVLACLPLVALSLSALVFVDPLAVLAGFVPVAIVLPTLAWLDRVEPEPTSSRLHAVLWGGTVAVVVSLVLNLSAAAVFGETVAIVLGAPLFEEAMKGLGIVWAVRRHEVDGVTDGIVFAGWVALGFAVVEDVTYFVDAHTSGVLLVTFVVRAVLTPFAHPLFTMWTGLAIGRAVRAGRPVWPSALWGYGLAVAAHAAWNGSLTLAAPDPDTGDGGSGVLILVIVFPLFVALFVAVCVALVRMRRAEQRRFVSQWPFLMQRYGLTPAEQALFVDWKRMLATRRSLRRRDRRRFDAMRAALARLSMLHTRLGQPDDATERVLADQLADARRRLRPGD